MAASPHQGARTLRPYLIGYALALALTGLPFALVAWHALPASSTLAIIAVAAVVQMLVHLRFFLHVSPKTSAPENLIVLAFAAVLIVILVGGSLWILFDLYQRMGG